jgi:hypothetical protein
VGLYSRWIFPRLRGGLMDQPALAELRKESLADVGGDILPRTHGTMYRGLGIK